MLTRLRIIVVRLALLVGGRRPAERVPCECPSKLFKLGNNFHILGVCILLRRLEPDGKILLKVLFTVQASTYMMFVILRGR